MENQLAWGEELQYQPQFAFKDYLQNLTAVTLGFLSFNPHLKTNPHPRDELYGRCPSPFQDQDLFSGNKVFTALSFFGSFFPAQIEL